MKCMVTWKIPPGSHQAATESFLSGGAPMPEGVQCLGRWHAPGSVYGWLLVEGDLTAIGQHVAEWANLLELQTTPVLEDAEAASSLSKALGK